MIDAIATDQSYLPLKFSRNKLSHTIDAADPALTSRVGLKYFLTISIPEYQFSEVFEELHTSEGRETPVDTQSGVQVYAGAEFRYNSGRNGKIDGLLTYTKPQRKQTAMTVVLSQTTAFKLTEDVTGGEPAVETNNPLGKMYAIKAGLQNDDFYSFGENFFTQWQLGARQFLTWQPNYKRVGRDQEEYLHFLLNFTPKPQTLKLRMHWFNAIGEGSAAVTVMSLENPMLYAVVCCPVGAAVLEVPADAVRYEVWLSNENDKRVSEARSYYVDGFEEIYDRSVLFVNSLGGWDTLRLTGQAQSTLKVSQTVAELERPAAAPIDFSELKIINIEGEHEIAVSTGWIKRDAAAHLKYLDELLLSEEIFLITEKGHKPLKLINSTMVDEYDNADLVARSFNFRILDTVENYSNLPAAEPTQERATVWRGLGLRHILDAVGKRTGKVLFARLQKLYADDNTPVKPYTVKQNTDGDPDYLPPITDNSVVPGTTPYPNTEISRPGTFNRTNCGVSYQGGPATIVIAAGTFGGENAGDAQAMAEGRWTTMNTQDYANTAGTCTINDMPVRLALRHEIPMTGGTVIATGKEGPRVAVWFEGNSMPLARTGANPSDTYVYTDTVMPGVRNVIVYVLFGGADRQPCKLVLVGKGREIEVTSISASYVFDGVTVNSLDDPLTVKVMAL